MKRMLKRLRTSVSRLAVMAYPALKANTLLAQLCRMHRQGQPQTI
jgi:hypothetical protein